MIPFNKPAFLGTEVDNLQRAVTELAHISGDGHFTQESQRLLERYLGAPRVLLAHSCTAALEMSAILLDLKAGDEVICPSYTFVTTVSSFVLRGATPVFIDIRKDTLNIDERLIEQAITPRTRAISVVHYAGFPCEMETILAIAQRHGLYVIEDAAQALGSHYKGRPCGTFGDLACFSFHETKNIVCGEGGALVINRPDLIEQAEIIREKGTNRSRFFRGQVDKYTWVDLGSSFLPGELSAAYLLPQLQSMQRINERRTAVWQRYRDAFTEHERSGRVTLPIAEHATSANGHMFYLVFPDLASRTRYIAFMKSQGVSTVFHYIPLHSSPAGLRFGRVGSSMEQTDRISECLVRLPMYFNLTDDEVEHVIHATHAFFAQSVA